jgi:hypothetical protein
VDGAKVRRAGLRGLFGLHEAALRLGVAGGVQGYGNGLLLRAARANQLADVGANRGLALTFKKRHTGSPLKQYLNLLSHSLSILST